MIEIASADYRRWLHLQRRNRWPKNSFVELVTWMLIVCYSTKTLQCTWFVSRSLLTQKKNHATVESLWGTFKKRSIRRNVCTRTEVENFRSLSTFHWLEANARNNFCSQSFLLRVFNASASALSAASFNYVKRFVSHARRRKQITIEQLIRKFSFFFIKSRKALMIDFKLVSWFPDVEQTNRRMKTIEDGKWHRDVSDYHPSPLPEELQVWRSKARMSFD